MHFLSAVDRGTAAFRRRPCAGPITASHIAPLDALGVADLADRGVHALVQQSLPPPRSRQGLDQRTSGCGFEVGAGSVPSGATMHLRPPRRQGLESQNENTSGAGWPNRFGADAARPLRFGR
jgi:hypothetical protein